MRNTMDGASVAAMLGVAAVLTTSVAAIALAAPNSAVARFTDLAPASEARAMAFVDGTSPTAADLASAQRETIRSLRQAPANATGWLRLAYVDSRGPEGLGRTGVEALARSYAAAPFGPDDTAWRLRFAFNHWSRLDRPTRLLALDELRIALAVNAPSVGGLSQDVSDSAGYLAVKLAIDQAQRGLARS